MPIDQLPQQKRNSGHIIWLHAIVVILIWLSPILLHWWLVAIGILAYYLQIIFLGDCILTRRQFEVKKRSVTFYYFILVKMGFTPDMYRVRFIADYIMPWVILGIALLLQVVLKFQPFVY